VNPPGYDRARRSLERRLFGWRMRRAVHPERFAHFGERSVLVPPARVNAPHRIHIGDDVLIHDSCWLSVFEEYLGERFEPTLTIGDRTRLGRYLYISCIGRIDIAEDVLGGDRILIADSYHGYEDPHTPISRQPMAEPRPVTIEAGVLLNVDVNILPGVTIGARSYIGAGTVVTRSCPPNSVVVGNPGRIIRHYDHDRERWVDGEP
jgi:acetyltransferase-like isoleucine patch superfamily enzyme